MESTTIEINRTKEELKRYSIFSAIERRPFRRAMEYVGPILGVILIGLFFILPDVIFLLLGVFLTVYPFMLRRMVTKSSNSSYDKNNLKDYKINITFNKDSFSTTSSDTTQDIKYSDIFRVYIREKDMIIYVSKFSGLYINRESYSDEVINIIISLLKTAVSDKLKTFK